MDGKLNSCDMLTFSSLGGEGGGGQTENCTTWISTQKNCITQGRP